MIHKTILMMAAAAAALLTTGGCNSLLDIDDEYYHIATQEQQWQTQADTRSALFGVYGLMRTALGENNTYWAVGDLRGGDFTVAAREDLQAIRDNRLKADYPLIRQICNWNRYYRVINAAAVFIENAGKVVENDRSYSEVNLQYDVAQARALRALAYFRLVQMWGDVPLITAAYDNGSFPQVARTDAAQVLAYVKRELLDIVTKLPVQLGSSSDLYYGGNAAKWRGWLLNRYSVYALLAHVSAWQGYYVDAETYAGYIIDNMTAISATYTTTANLVSATGIFSQQYSSTYSGARLITFGSYYSGTSVNEPSADGHIEAWTLAEPHVRKPRPEIYVSRDSLSSIFTRNSYSDARFGYDETLSPPQYYENYITALNQDIPVFGKIKVVRNGSDATNDFALFGSFTILSRIEDMALLRAEALCMLNRATDAVDYLNTVRALRSLPATTFSKTFGNNTQALLREVFHERRRELMGEGHRWFDRIRLSRLLPDDEPEIASIELMGGIYLPVAQDVIDANPLITQTDYWK